MVFHRRRQTHAVGLNQPAEQFGRRRNGDLLAEDRAHREFKTVPCAGNAQSRPCRDQRRQHRVQRQMRADRIGIGGEIEHPPHPGDDLRQRRHVGKSHRDVDPVLVSGRDADHAAVVADRDGAPVDIFRDDLDAGNGARFEKRQHRIPVIGRPIGETHRQGARFASGLVAAVPQRRGRAAEQTAGRFR